MDVHRVLVTLTTFIETFYVQFSTRNKTDNRLRSIDLDNISPPEFTIILFQFIYTE